MVKTLFDLIIYIVEFAAGPVITDYIAGILNFILGA